MELNRNHYFIIGIVLFLLGFQFRHVASFELNEKSSRFVEKRLGASPAPQPQYLAAMFTGPAAPPRQVVRPPRWLGFSLMSVGGVLFLFSLQMKKPGP